MKQRLWKREINRKQRINGSTTVDLIEIVGAQQFATEYLKDTECMSSQPDMEGAARWLRASKRDALRGRWSHSVSAAR